MAEKLTEPRYEEEAMACCAEAEPESLASILATALKRIEKLEAQVEYLNVKLNTRPGRDELASELEHHILSRLQLQMGHRR